MRVRLLVGHPANNRPKVKMARVEGCTFFRRGDSWRHADNSCERHDHWIHNMRILIGQCTLVHRGAEWTHESGPRREGDKTEIKSGPCDAATAWTEARETLETKPACILDPDFVHALFTVDGCEFEMADDIVYHVGLRCKRKEHGQDFGGHGARLTRTPSKDLNDFVNKAVKALSAIVVPPDTRNHITVEV